MKSHLLFRLTSVCVSVSLLSGLLSLVGGTALANPILPGYDLLSTPPGGGVLDLSGVGGPAAFPLQGRPIGPGNTDTIVQRFGTLPPLGTGIIPAQLVALSLESISPVFLPGPNSFFDVFVDLDPSLTSLGQLNILTHNDPLGGLFNSSFVVNSRTTFTQVGNPVNTFQVFRTDSINSTNSPWSHQAPPDYPHVAAYPSGNFYPGVVGVSSSQDGQPVGITHTGPHPHTDPAQMSDTVRIFDPTLDPPNASKDFQVDDANEGLLQTNYQVIAPNQWILFKEPNGSDSDRLMIRAGLVYFQSDPLGPLFGDLPPFPNAVVIENGQFQRADLLFQGYIGPRIDVFSDLDTRVDVPEPGSVLLLVIGGVVLAFATRSRRA